MTLGVTLTKPARILLPTQSIRPRKGVKKHNSVAWISKGARAWNTLLDCHGSGIPARLGLNHCWESFWRIPHALISQIHPQSLSFIILLPLTPDSEGAATWGINWPFIFCKSAHVSYQQGLRLNKKTTNRWMQAAASKSAILSPASSSSLLESKSKLNNLKLIAALTVVIKSMGRTSTWSLCFYVIHQRKNGKYWASEDFVTLLYHKTCLWWHHLYKYTTRMSFWLIGPRYIRIWNSKANQYTVLPISYGHSTVGCSSDKLTTTASKSLYTRANRGVLSITAMHGMCMHWDIINLSSVISDIKESLFLMLTFRCLLSWGFRENVAGLTQFPRNCSNSLAWLPQNSHCYWMPPVMLSMIHMK